MILKQLGIISCTEVLTEKFLYSSMTLWLQIAKLIEDDLLCRNILMSVQVCL